MNKITKTSFDSGWKNRGFTLVESIFVAIIIALGIAATYSFYQRVYAGKVAYEESQKTLEITQRINRAYTAMGDFTDLSTTQVIRDGLVPSTMGVGDGTIETTFGGSLVVQPVEIGGVANGGFMLTHTNVAKKFCYKMVRATNQLNRYASIHVSPYHGEGTVPDPDEISTVATRGLIDENALSEACGRAANLNISFVQEKTQLAVAASPGAGSDLCVVPAPQTRTIHCPVGQTGSITETRAGMCETAYGLPVWGAWTVETNTCGTTCTPSPTSPETRTSACPSGQQGTILERRLSTCASPSSSPEWSSWEVVSSTCATACVPQAPEIRTSACPTGLGDIKERRISTCPSPTGSPVWGTWTVYENNCTGECVVPDPSYAVRWRSGSRACPTGYEGTIYYEYGEIQTASCPQTMGSPVWSEWAPNGETRNENDSQCTPVCDPDPVLVRWVYTNDICLDGFFGQRNYERQQVRTSICEPGATSPVTSMWSDSGVLRNEVNTCTSCPAPVNDPETQWVTRNLDCEPGFLGTWTKEYEQTRVKTTSYHCPPGTPVLPAASETWSGWSDTGQIRNEQKACEPVCTPPANTSEQRTDRENRTVACPGFGGGTITQYRDNLMTRAVNYYCPAMTGPYSTNYGEWAVLEPGTWVTTSDTCQIPACDGTLQGNAQNYMTRYPELYAIYGNNYAAAYQHWYQVGYQEGRQSCWEAPCVLPTPSDETRSENQTIFQNVLSCSTGFYGTNRQEKTQRRDSTRNAICPAPTGAYTWSDWTAYGTWYDTSPWTASTSSCVACPAASSETETQWVASTSSCAAGTYGSISIESEQTRSRSKTYSCPTGTATLPAPTYGTWSTWANTGNTRNSVNSCQTCPANTTEMETQWITVNQGCDTGYTGTKTYEQEQTRSRSVTYSCPAGTTTLPAPLYGSWGSWANTANTRNPVNTCVKDCQYKSYNFSWTVGARTCSRKYLNDPATIPVGGTSGKISGTGPGGSHGDAYFTCQNVGGVGTWVIDPSPVPTCR